jgi:rhamnosyltransferase
MTGVLFVTLNPTKKFIESFNSIEPQVQKILIIDNGSNAESRKLIAEIQSRFPEKILLKYFDENTGMAHPYNLGLPFLFKEGCDSVMISDQDTSYDKDYMKELIDVRRKYGDHLYSGNIADVNSGEGKKYEIFKKFYFYRTRNFQQGVIECSFLLSSGTLISKNIFKKVGRFEEKLFNASVEIEYCLRAKLKGVKSFAVEKALIKHEQGKSKKITPFLNSKQYTPARLYYIGRAQTLVMKKYKFLFGFDLWVIMSLLHYFFVILLLEGNKIEKINKLFDGCRQGLFKESLS